MVPFYQILLPLFSLFLVRVDLTDLFPLHIKVKVLKIYDGDTLLVSHGSYRMKVRLSKIDAPEMKQPFLTKPADAGLYSAKCLNKRIKKGSLYELRIEKWDIYGRILGDIGDSSLWLIKKGCSTLYPHAEFNSRSEKFLYLTELKKAKAQKLGLWKYGGIRQPKLWRRSKKRNVRRR